MTRFAPANTAAQKPRWSLAEVRAFQRELKAFRKSLNYSQVDLAKALDYSTKYCRMMQGDFRSTRQPSEEFLRRFNSLHASAPKPKPAFLPALAFKPETDAIPVVRILASIKQCPECVWEMKRGYRDEPDTWWVMRVPRQMYHSKEHRAAAQLRRRRREQRRRKKNARSNHHRTDRVQYKRRHRRNHARRNQANRRVPHTA
jgi:hypothetical protein